MNQPIVVSYAMAGSARNGSDYTLSGNPGQIVIDAGQTSGSATLIVTTSKTKGSEKAKMILNAGTGYNLSAGTHKRRHRAPQASLVIHNR